MTGPPVRWSPAVAVLHWINAALILTLLALGWAMTRRVFDAGVTFDLYQWHKSLGSCALALTVLRLLARALTRRPPLPPGPEGLLGGSAQAAFYGLTLTAAGAGWLLVSASPLPVPTRIFGLFVAPDIASPDPALFAAGVLAHRLAAWAIAALLALHIAGALKHRWIDRDDTLRRMSPWPRQGEDEPPTRPPRFPLDNCARPDQSP